MSSTAKLPFGRIFNAAAAWARNVAVALTGSTDETELARILIPGGMLGAFGDMVLDLAFSSTATDDQIITATLGNVGAVAETVFTETVSTAITTNKRITLSNRGAADAQLVIVDGAAAHDTTAIDTDRDMVLTVTGTLVDDSDTLTLQKINATTLYRD